jgi:curved DNA-binding protein CbpA
MKIFQTIFRKCLTFALFVIISSSHNIHAQQISVDELAQALLSQMSPEEQEQLLRETEALFQSLSPEELMELGKASEELLREELKKEGLELLPIEPQQPAEQKPETQKPVAETPSTEKTDDDKFGEPLIQIDSKLLNRAKVIINEIVEMIAEIEQRSENQRAYKDKIATIQADIDLLSSLLNIINQFKLVQYFAEEKHSATYEQIISLYNQLNQHIDTFKPEKSIESTNPYHDLGLSSGATEDQVKKQYRTLTTEYDPQLLEKKLQEEGLSPEIIHQRVAKAKIKFNKVVDSFQRIKTEIATEKAFNALYKALQRAIVTHNISQGIKNIFETHAPEAAKLATEAEKRAAEARKTQEAGAQRYPSYSPMVFEQYQQPPFPYYPDMYGRPGGSGTPSVAPVSEKPAPPAPIKAPEGKGSEGKKGDDKKKPEEPKEKILGEKTFYQALKIPNNATGAQIEKAYADMQKRYQETDIDTIKDWDLINDAYEILKDSELRSMYNRYLHNYLPKEARAKIKEYQKNRGQKQKEGEIAKKAEELNAPKTAQEAQQLFSNQTESNLSDATAQLDLEATTLTDFDAFLQKPYTTQDLSEINLIKNILSLATSYVDTAIQDIKQARTDKLLQDNASEANTFNKNALKAISNFLAHNRTILQKLKSIDPAAQTVNPATGQLANLVVDEKQYIFFGIQNAPALVPGAIGLAQIQPNPLAQEVIDANPNEINFVGNFISKLKELETITASIQNDLQQAMTAATTPASGTAATTP